MPRVRVLVVDNYDSFTYNLVQYVGTSSDPPPEIEVVRNDHATVDELLIRGYDRVIVSPGPCTPDEAGISLEAVRRFPEAGIATLGVCLGHQALVQAWGGRVITHQPVHGKTARIEHDGRTIFRGLPSAAGGRALPLAHRRAVTAGGAGVQRRGRGRGDGGPPPRAARRGGPISPRVDSHPARTPAARQLPGQQLPPSGAVPEPWPDLEPADPSLPW